MARFKVITRPLNHNGRRLRVGWTLELADADGAVLMRANRVEPYAPPERKRRKKV